MHSPAVPSPQLSRTKRHLDATSVYRFWKSLDSWNKAKHSELRY